MSEEEEHMQPGQGPPKWVLWIITLVMIAISIGLASVDWR